jgi:hypothetical protein
MKKMPRGIAFHPIVFLLLILSTSLANAQEKVRSLILRAENEAYVLRCFSEYNSKIKAHSVAVGDPSEVNYLYDADNGTLLKVWKGQFADVGNMWIERGGGNIKTPVPSKDITDAPSVATLNNKAEMWPDSLGSIFKFKGYKVDKQGRPTFKYSISNISVEDKILPLDSKEGLSRTITVTGGENQKDLYILVAEGGDIRKSGKNTYTITGKDFTIKISETGKLKPVIRESNGRKELLVQLPASTSNSFNYSIIF